MRIDLASEYWQAGTAVRGQHYQRLMSLGCPIRSLADLAPRNWPFGIAKVRWLPGGLYEPDDTGVPAVIMAVADDDGDILTTPDLYDLIAWQTSRPRHWAWRTGLGAALGERLIDECDVLPVVETPLDWLSRAGQCLCILDWQAPATFWARLRSGPRLLVQSEDLRGKLQAAFVRTAPLPDMEVSCAA